MKMLSLFFLITIGAGVVAADAPPQDVKVFDGECADGKEVRMYEGNGDNEGTAAQRTVKCSQACREQKAPLSGTWTGFVALGFIVVPTTGRCYCENADAFTCKRGASSSPYDRYMWADLSHHKTFDGECSDGKEIRMYEGNGDNPGTAEERIIRCSAACQAKKTALSGSWSGFVALGFVVVPTTGRCYCESASSLTCKRGASSSPYDRYDWNTKDLAHLKIFDGECTDGKEVRMFEGNGDNPGTAVERTIACSKACRAKKTALSGTWTGFVALGFIVVPTTGRCYCENADALTCKRTATSSPYDRYIWTSDLVHHKTFDGECSDGKEIRMYEGNGDNPGTAEERTIRCSAACKAKKAPLSGSWSGFVALGFVVIPTNGRCYCESASSLQCKRGASSSPYDRYDWGVAGQPKTTTTKPVVVTLPVPIKPLPLGDAIGIKLLSKETIASFGLEQAAGFFHDDANAGVLHFFGKDLLHNGKSLTSSGRRLGADDTNRVQQLEDQVEALQATVRRLAQTVSSLLETKSEQILV